MFPMLSITGNLDSFFGEVMVFISSLHCLHQTAVLGSLVGNNMQKKFCSWIAAMRGILVYIRFKGQMLA